MAKRRKNQENDLFALIDELISFEKKWGVTFDENQFPIFEPEDFLRVIPERIVPYSHRNDTANKANTIVCFYEPDKLLYRKLTFDKLIDVSKELNHFQGFVGFDLSIFRDYLYPFQQFFILANLVISKFLTLGGNKLYPNLRTDETNGDSYFYLFSKAPIVCCGTLGCSKKKSLKESNKRQIDRYCDIHPKQFLIQYGPKISSKKNTINIKAYGRKESKHNG